MQIGETIRKYRKEKNMTQEEMARRLGVTPPAVNKWENGNTCPDIQLLAPISRLLGISVDTLLSFQGELTDEEIKQIVSETDAKFEEGTYEEAFDFIRKKLEEYPNSEQLAWQLALILDVRCTVRKVENSEKYEPFIVECYTRALKSNNEAIRYQAAESLYNLYLRKEEYNQAEKYLDYISSQNPERKRRQAVIYERTGRLREAYKAYEELLFSYYQMNSLVFHSLYMLALQEKDMERARYYVEKRALLARLFDMGTYYEESAWLELETCEKNAEAVVETAEKMLAGIEKIREFTVSPLYRHMTFKEPDEGFTEMMKENLLKCFKDEESFGFMEENARWKKLLEIN